MTQSQYEIHQDRDARRDAATLRIKEKIAVLEVWFADGVPEGYEWHEQGDTDKTYGCPINLNQLQKWSDAGLKVEVRLDGKKHTVAGVHAFSAVTLDKPERSGLKKRAVELLGNIKKRPSGKKELAKLRAEKQTLETFTQELVNANAQLRHEIMALQEDFELQNAHNRNLITRIKELEDDLDKVRDQLRKVESIRPVE